MRRYLVALAVLGLFATSAAAQLDMNNAAIARQNPLNSPLPPPAAPPLPVPGSSLPASSSVGTTPRLGVGTTTRVRRVVDEPDTRRSRAAKSHAAKSKDAKSQDSTSQDSSKSQDSKSEESKSQDAKSQAAKARQSAADKRTRAVVEENDRVLDSKLKSICRGC